MSENDDIFETISIDGFTMSVYKNDNCISECLRKGQFWDKQYFDAYPGIADFLEASVQKAKRNGYAETILHRRLYLEPHDSQLSRVAKNMPIQGTSAEIAKLAMIRLNERLWHHYPNAFLVNMIHDELVVECPKEDGEAVAAIVVEEMERAQQTLLPNVKPKADVHLGKTWVH